MRESIYYSYLGETLREEHDNNNNNDNDGDNGEHSGETAEATYASSGSESPEESLGCGCTLSTALINRVSEVIGGALIDFSFLLHIGNVV